MGVQVTLKDIQSGFLTATTHTANNTLIEGALDKALDRTANTNNAMQVDFDMGLNEIINLSESRGKPLNAVNRQEVEEYVAAVVGNAVAGLQPGEGGGDVIIVEETGQFYRQTSAATEGQTVFAMQTPYTPHSNTLSVYVNGVLQVKDLDYEETDSLTVTFLDALTAADTVQFVYSKTLTAVPTNVYLTKVVRLFENVAGQTAFPIAYNPGNVDVFLNGIKLQNQEDYEAVDGAQVVLTKPVGDALDFVEITAYADFAIANHYTKEEVYRKDETYSQTQTYRKDETYTQAEVDAAIALGSSVPAGVMLPFAGSSLPTNYLWCRGQAVNRTTYSALFAAIGTTYGQGNGLTTFNLPDTRGEFLRGLDAGRGVDSGRTLGSSQAEETNSDAHTHKMFTKTNHLGGGSGGIDGSPESPVVFASGAGDGQTILQRDITGAQPTAGVTSPAQGGGSETRPRNIAVNYIIKY